jgi:hypothetical protein
MKGITNTQGSLTLSLNTTQSTSFRVYSEALRKLGTI